MFEFLLNISGQGIAPRRQLIVAQNRDTLRVGFDRLVGEWLRDASEGKQERMAGLCALLGKQAETPDLRYHLFHRTASAILEARRFGAPDVVMMVQAFAE